MLEHWLIQVGYVAMVIAGFGFLIFIHEFGHFIVAKWKGVKVIKFSLGFGPAFFKFRKGETEYALSIIPLGGFCKLAGEMIKDEGKQSEEGENDIPPERLLTSKTVGQRAQIFAAGAALNLLVAFPLGVLMVLVGGDEPIAKVDAGPGGAYVAGIHTGDLVTSVNGEEVRFWYQMTDAIANAPLEKPFPVTVERVDDDGTAQTRTYQVMRESNEDLTLGLGLYTEIKIGFVHPASPARKAGLKKGDEIVTVKKLEGTAAPVSEWWDFESVIRSSPGKQITIGIRRKNPNEENGYESRDIAVTPEEETSYEIGVVFGSGLAEPIIGLVQGDSPASGAGIRSGDRIIAIDGKEMSTWSDITNAIKGAGLVIHITIERVGAEMNVVAERRAPESLLGIASTRVSGMIQAVDDGSPAQNAGLLPGDIVKKIDEEAIGNLGRGILFEDEREHTIEVARGVEVLVVKVTPHQHTYGKLGVTSSAATAFHRPDSLFAAVSKGVGNTLFIFKRTFGALAGLVSGKVGAKELSGPVGIISMSYMRAQSSLQDFIHFILIITISLGVFNLLPIPILDGGHIAFLIIEKIKGKPVGERTFVVAQYVGLAFLLGLVVFVTKNDFANFIF
ncbi:MAG: RIP metalloprotease RseP [Planctomycetes bacterium]|nr:RIP metalloprotease RseP [Planctomycetota bacterium]